jgi:dipeptidyl aminopeptidase/acylaminoacyl peptidase
MAEVSALGAAPDQRTRDGKSLYPAGMTRSVAAFIIFACASFAGAQGNLPTLKQIMADPSWFARSPDAVGWLADGSGVLYDQRREGVLGRDTQDRFVLMLEGVSPAGWPRMLEEAERPRAIPAGGDRSPDGQRMVTTHSGDLFLWDPSQPGGWRQLTRTTAWESSPMFLADGGRIAFRRGGAWVIRDLATGFEAEAADVRFEEDPAEKKPETKDDLAQREHDLFGVIREEEERRRANEVIGRSRAEQDATRVPGPFYLDPERRERGQYLGPDGRWLLVATAPRSSPGVKTDQMPRYVTDSGYVTTSRLRPKVGVERREPTGFVLLDLRREKSYELPLDDLPGIRDDPLAQIKAAAAARKKEQPDETPEAQDKKADDAEASEAADTPERKGSEPGAVRGTSLRGVRWSDSGRHAVVMLRSNDNKDRWILAVDTTRTEPAWRVVHYHRDPAWQAGFNAFGFVPGTETVWFESEHAGWGHLYLSDPDTDAEPRALTSGAWEIRDTVALQDGSGFVVRTNRKDLGIYEIERIALDGLITPITDMDGSAESFELSPAQDRLLFQWSATMDPPELFAVDLRGGDPVRLTRTDTDLYRSFAFTKPEFVKVPSSHADGAVHTRVYLPDPERFPGPRPIVIFAHGAGYLRFAFQGWSENYFREHMFHSLLTDRGFVVLGPDFRHSEGYGRDWRTAVYRDMGEPELQDFDDCIAYAAEHFNADPERVGIYGGSYGGFLTLMALFQRPEVYDAGAALRSVTDWRHYNHGWTSNILDTPDVDPEPFDRCSPISHAENLRGALLMLHGLEDDNVVAQDVIRLSQRLIELEKHDWELALYPVEPHGFQEPSSWLDEYRRILELFEEHLLD